MTVAPFATQFKGLVSYTIPKVTVQVSSTIQSLPGASLAANLVVPSGATARLNADSRVDMYGTLAGAGTLNLYVPFVRTTLFTDWSAFTGTINVITDADGGDLRMGTSYGFPGFPQAAVAR